jgi:CBS domain-containing protein
MSAVMESLSARDVMTREVICVPASMPVASLARLLAERGISAVPVTGADGRLLGIVTELDLIRRLSGAEDRRPGWIQRLFGDRDRDAERYAQVHGMLAEDVMTRSLVTVTEDSSVEHIAHLMEERGIRRVPVLRGERLVGLVSRADLLQALLVPPAALGDGAEEDERIREAVWKEVREQPWADMVYTFVSVKDGVVEFQGFARSPAVRRGLQAIAHRVQGVRQVVDNMEEGIPQIALY